MRSIESGTGLPPTVLRVEIGVDEFTFLQHRLRVSFHDHKQTGLY